MFGNDEVTGKDMFKFKSRHTKHDLQNKVSEATSNLPKSPVKLNIQFNRLNLANGQDTPDKVKHVIKKSKYIHFGLFLSKYESSRSTKMSAKK